MAKIIDEVRNENGMSFQIDFGNGMVLWYDAWKNKDGEVTGDWNKYIFRTDNAQDMEEKAFQDANSDEAGAYNFATALELAEERIIEMCEVCGTYEDEDGRCGCTNVDGK